MYGNLKYGMQGNTSFEPDEAIPTLNLLQTGMVDTPGLAAVTNSLAAVDGQGNHLRTIEYIADFKTHVMFECPGESGVSAVSLGRVEWDVVGKFERSANGYWSILTNSANGHGAVTRGKVMVNEAYPRQPEWVANIQY